MDDKKSTYGGFTEARARANKKYMEKFVEVKVRMTPEKRSAIQEHARSMGESATVFINRAIDQTMIKDDLEGHTAALTDGAVSVYSKSGNIVSTAPDGLAEGAADNSVEGSGDNE